MPHALVEFHAAHQDGVYSAKRTIDPLLSVWALASSFGRAAARPVEAVLRTLVDLSIVTAEELSACADEGRTTMRCVPRACTWWAASPCGALPTS